MRPKLHGSLDNSSLGGKRCASTNVQNEVIEARPEACFRAGDASLDSKLAQVECDPRASLSMTPRCHETTRPKRYCTSPGPMHI